MKILYAKTKKYIILVIAFVATILITYYAYVRDINESSEPDLVEKGFDNLRIFIPKQGIALKCYESDEGIWYAFLPSFCENTISGDMSIESDIDGKVLAIDYELLKSGEDYSEYRVSIMIGDNYESETGVLRIMHSRNLPSVYINTQSGNLSAVNDDKNTIEDINIAIIDEDGELLFKDKKATITGHGNRSFLQDKKPYTIETSKKTPLFGMHSSDKWILVSNVCDPTGIQNAITYNMARNAGMQYSPEFQYVDVYMNSLYHGTYLVAEKIQINENNMNFNNLNKQNRELNSWVATKPDVQNFETEYSKGYLLDKLPGDISGGYILERDYGKKYKEERAGFTSAVMGDNYVLKSPGNASYEQVEYIRGLVDGFEQAVMKKDGSYADYIDVDSFVDKYIIEELTQNEGAGSTSAFYYKPQDSISKLIFAGPVWDYDTAYATYGAPDRLCYSAVHPLSPTKLYYNLYRNNSFKEKVEQRYEEFYSQYMDGPIQEDMDYYQELCEASFKMNALRWNDNNFSYISATKEVENYIAARKQFLDRAWINNEELVTVHFSFGENEWNYSVLPGTELDTPIMDYDGNWINCDTKEKYDVNKGIVEDASYIFVTE